MALTKAHHINFYDSDDMGCIDKAPARYIKNLIPRQVNLNNSVKQKMKEINHNEYRNYSKSI